jgi:proteasome lid subunit RPN8/RPN11
VAGHGQRAWPLEACGLLIGSHENGVIVVDHAIESANLAGDQAADRFEVDPALLLRCQREARDRGQAVVGVYHSHPNGQAVPSTLDLSGAWQDQFVWLIAGIKPDTPPALAAYWRGETARFDMMDFA